MKVLVLGATGMLGHKLVQNLSRSFSTYGTIRSSPETFADHPAFKLATLIGGVDAYDMNCVKKVINSTKPDFVINSIGIVKQLTEALDPIKSITINSLFPHQLAGICQQKNIRLIHVSTDCVFSGNRGNYSENDPSDADDLYGKTKYLGEVACPACLTIRTSIIGRELNTAHGLIDWFLSQEGKTISGYQKAIFSGLTTIALSEIIGHIISDYPELNGVLQVASNPISKFDLLNLVKKIYCMNIIIERDIAVINDRSLNADKFRKKTNIKIPSWEYMIKEMYRDPTPYAAIRGNHA